MAYQLDRQPDFNRSLKIGELAGAVDGEGVRLQAARRSSRKALDPDPQAATAAPQGPPTSTLPPVAAGSPPLGPGRQPPQTQSRQGSSPNRPHPPNRPAGLTSNALAGLTHGAPGASGSALPTLVSVTPSSPPSSGPLAPSKAPPLLRLPVTPAAPGSANYAGTGNSGSLPSPLSSPTRGQQQLSHVPGSPVLGSPRAAPTTSLPQPFQPPTYTTSTPQPASVPLSGPMRPLPLLTNNSSPSAPASSPAATAGGANTALGLGQVLDALPSLGSSPGATADTPAPNPGAAMSPSPSCASPSSNFSYSSAATGSSPISISSPVRPPPGLSPSPANPTTATIPSRPAPPTCPQPLTGTSPPGPTTPPSSSASAAAAPFLAKSTVRPPAATHPLPGALRSPSGRPTTTPGVLTHTPAPTDPAPALAPSPGGPQVHWDDSVKTFPIPSLRQQLLNLNPHPNPHPHAPPAVSSPSGGGGSLASLNSSIGGRSDAGGDPSSSSPFNASLTSGRRSSCGHEGGPTSGRRSSCGHEGSLTSTTSFKLVMAAAHELQNSLQSSLRHNTHNAATGALHHPQPHSENSAAALPSPYSSGASAAPDALNASLAARRASLSLDLPPPRLPDLLNAPASSHGTAPPVHDTATAPAAVDSPQAKNAGSAAAAVAAGKDRDRSEAHVRFQEPPPPPHAGPSEPDTCTAAGAHVPAPVRGSGSSSSGTAADHLNLSLSLSASLGGRRCSTAGGGHESSSRLVMAAGHELQNTLSQLLPPSRGSGGGGGGSSSSRPPSSGWYLGGGAGGGVATSLPASRATTARHSEPGGAPARPQPQAPLPPPNGTSVSGAMEALRRGTLPLQPLQPVLNASGGGGSGGTGGAAASRPGSMSGAVAVLQPPASPGSPGATTPGSPSLPASARSGAKLEVVRRPSASGAANGSRGGGGGGGGLGVSVVGGLPGPHWGSGPPQAAGVGSGGSSGSGGADGGGGGAGLELTVRGIVAQGGQEEQRSRDGAGGLPVQSSVRQPLVTEPVRLAVAPGGSGPGEAGLLGRVSLEATPRLVGPGAGAGAVGPQGGVGAGPGGRGPGVVGPLRPAAAAGAVAEACEVAGDPDGAGLLHLAKALPRPRTRSASGSGSGPSSRQPSWAGGGSTAATALGLSRPRSGNTAAPNVPVPPHLPPCPPPSRTGTTTLGGAGHCHVADGGVDASDVARARAFSDGGFGPGGGCGGGRVGLALEGGLAVLERGVLERMRDEELHNTRYAVGVARGQMGAAGGPVEAAADKAAGVGARGGGGAAGVRRRSSGSGSGAAAATKAACKATQQGPAADGQHCTRPARAGSACSPDGGMAPDVHASIGSLPLRALSKGAAAGGGGGGVETAGAARAD